MSAFDAYDGDYAATVDRSIAFSGLSHQFFLEAKVVVLLEALRARGLDPAACRLLDVGCGVGELHSRLTPLFAEVQGVDPSETCLKTARVRNPTARYQLCEAGALPQADGSADVALATCVLHHVPVGERTTFAAELKRVLRPGGVAVVIEHNPFNPLTRLSVMRCPFDEDAVLLRDRSAERLLSGAGFRDLRSGHFLLLPWTGRPVRRVERALRRLPLGAQYATVATA